MERSEGGEWDNCNSIINKIYLKKKESKASFKIDYLDEFARRWLKLAI